MAHVKSNNNVWIGRVEASGFHSSQRTVYLCVVYHSTWIMLSNLCFIIGLWRTQQHFSDVFLPFRSLPILLWWKWNENCIFAAKGKIGTTNRNCPLSQFSSKQWWFKKHFSPSKWNPWGKKKVLQCNFSMKICGKWAAYFEKRRLFQQRGFIPLYCFPSEVTEKRSTRSSDLSQIFQLLWRWNLSSVILLASAPQREQTWF